MVDALRVSIVTFFNLSYVFVHCTLTNSLHHMYTHEYREKVWKAFSDKRSNVSAEMKKHYMHSKITYFLYTRHLLRFHPLCPALPDLLPSSIMFVALHFVVA